MYTLRTGTDLGRMVGTWPEDFVQDLGDGPVLLVIQSAVMQAWFRQEAARRLGLAFLPRIMVPEKAWRSLLDCLGPGLQDGPGIVAEIPQPVPAGPARNCSNSPAAGIPGTGGAPGIPDRGDGGTVRPFDPGEGQLGNGRPAKLEALFLDDLILLCYRHLKEIRKEIEQGGPAAQDLAKLYAPVLPWLGFARTGEDGRELVRIHQADQLFTLANECAGVFFAYAQNPPELPETGECLLDLWQAGEDNYCARMFAAAGLAYGGFGTAMQRHEAWQAHLFRRLGIHPAAGRYGAGPGGGRQTSGAGAGDTAAAGGADTGSILGLLMADAIRRQREWRGPWKKVVVFGSSFLSRQAFDFLFWLSGGIEGGAPGTAGLGGTGPAGLEGSGRASGSGLDVRHYLFLPAAGALPGSQARVWSELGRDLLDHMARRGLAVGATAAGQGEAGQEGTEAVPAPGREDDAQESGRPDVAGDVAPKPGRPEVAAGEVAAAGGPGTAEDSDLARIRRLCEGREPVVLAGDGSFRLVSGPGQGRQVEALYGLILAELHRGTACRDILVMAPDIQPWRPWIEAVFGPPGRRFRPDQSGGSPEAAREGNSGATPAGTADRIDLPWNMSDLSLQGSSDYLTALRLLLDLGRNRWERPAVFALLDNPCFSNRHGLGQAEREGFLRFADDAMIRWGLDAGHRRALGGGSSDGQSWNAAFERFCLDLPGRPVGAGGDEELTGTGETAFVSASGSMGEGDLEYGQAESQVTGKIFRLLHDLAGRFRHWKTAERGLREWIQLHRDLMDDFLAAPDEIDRNHAEAAQNTLNNLSNLLRPGRETMADLRLDWFTFLRFFQDQLDQVEDGLGHRLSNGITFSSLRPWRAVSYPLIILLGMNEADYPRQEAAQPFDLAAVARFLKDRGAATLPRPDAETQDTYAWLETLYAARKGLWVFHSGMDPHTGKERQPSPFISWIRSSLDPASLARVSQRIPVLAVSPADLAGTGQAADPVAGNAATATAATGTEATTLEGRAGKGGPGGRSTEQGLAPGNADPLMVQARLRAEVLAGRIDPVSLALGNPGHWPEAAGGPGHASQASQTGPAGHVAQDSLPCRDRTISLVELARIFQYPLRGCAKFRLGLVPLGNRDPRELADENLSPGYLDQRSWLMEELQALLGGSPARDARNLVQQSGAGHRHVAGSLEQLNETRLASQLDLIGRGADFVLQRLSGSPADTPTGAAFPGLCPLADHWTSLEVASPGGRERWHLRHRSQLAWQATPGKSGGGAGTGSDRQADAGPDPQTPAVFVSFSDSAPPKLTMGKGSSKTKSTKAEDQAGALFALLPLVLAHGLGSHAGRPALAVAVSSKAGDNKSSWLSATLPAWPDGGADFRELVRSSLETILAEPLDLYPTLIQTLLEAGKATPADQLEARRQAIWDEFWLDFLEGEDSWQSGDSQSDRSDDPGKCPYHNLVFRSPPAYDGRISDLLDRFYQPLVQRVWDAIDLAAPDAGASDTGEE